MSITLSALQKQRRDSAANWTAENPTLLAGEIGIESDTGYWKVGDGSTAWTSLAYISGLGAEIPVSRLADGSARQLLQTAANGTDVEWTSNVDIPGTLDVTGAATFDAAVTIQGNLTVNGTTTTIDTQNLIVEDKNVIIGQVTTPTDVTADGGGITLKGTTDKTINWVDATDAWTSSERFSVPTGTAGAPSLTFTGDPNTGVYSPGADQVAISTGGSGRLFVDSSGIITQGTNNAPSGITALGFVSCTNTASGSSYIAYKSADATNPVSFNFSKSRGTNSSPTSILANDNIGSINFNAYNGTTFAGAGSIAVTATNISGGNISTDITFTTANAGSTTEKLRITSAGLVGVGTSSPGSVIDVRSSGAVPARFYADNFYYVEARGNAGTNGQTGFNSIVADGSGASTNFYCINAGGAGQLLVTNAYPLQFFTNNSERARIDSSGRLLVGTSSISSGDGQIYVQQDAINIRNLIALNNTGAGSTTAGIVAFYRQGTYTGGITNTNSSSAFVTSSDYRLKENIAPLDGAVDRINQLQVRRFNFIADPGNTLDGFIAHEVQQVVPEAIFGEKDAVDDDGNPIYQGIDHSRLVPLLTAALQEAIGRIQALEAEVAALKAQ